MFERLHCVEVNAFAAVDRKPQLVKQSGLDAAKLALPYILRSVELQSAALQFHPNTAPHRVSGSV